MFLKSSTGMYGTQMDLPYRYNENLMKIISHCLVDRTPPNCLPTQDANEITTLNSPGTTVTFQEPTANDNSGQVNLRSRSHAPGAFFPTGTTEVCYTFADPTQNTVDCCLNVIVTPGKWSYLAFFKKFALPVSTICTNSPSFSPVL